MSVVNVDPETADPEVAPDGTWHAMLVSSELRTRPEDLKFNPGDREVNWVFRLDDEDAGEANGGVVFQSTNIEPRKASAFVRFCNALGEDPTAFDPDVIASIPCIIRVKQKTMDDGRVFANVREIIGRR